MRSDSTEPAHRWIFKQLAYESGYDSNVQLKPGFVLDVRAICNVELMLKTLVQFDKRVPILLCTLVLTTMANNLFILKIHIALRFTIGFAVCRALVLFYPAHLLHQTGPTLILTVSSWHSLRVEIVNLLGRFSHGLSFATNRGKWLARMKRAVRIFGNAEKESSRGGEKETEARSIKETERGN